MQNILPFADLPARARIKRRPHITKSLLDSAITHMRVAVEFFNRLHQPHRHEIAAELALAAWKSY